MPSISETFSVPDNNNQTAHSHAHNKTKETTGHMFNKAFIASRAEIWKSSTSWRIATIVFLTIALVQACLMNFVTIRQFENDRLNEMTQIARAAISPIIKNKMNGVLDSPLDKENVNRLLNSTDIRGITIHTINIIDKQSERLEFIESYGEPTLIQPITIADLNKTYLSANGNRYETIISTSNVTGSYFFTLRLNSRKLQQQTLNFVWSTIQIMLLTSLFVTCVLMIAIGRWLLEPIIFMRENLLSAYESPEHPNIPPSPFDPKDEIGGAIEIAQNLIQQNATNLKQIKNTAEDKIHQLAYYDTLTSLPNRTLFIQHLNEQATAQRDGSIERLAVITIDLDHFKDINDSMGHNVGDAILRGVGKRLRASLPESVMVSRSGEDEFAVTAPLTTDLNSARDIAERIAGVIRGEPFNIFNESFQMRASIGVATFPDDGIKPDIVLKNADIALNRAKEEGRDTIKEYSEDFDRAVQARFQMLRDLRDALEQDQLNLYYQPQLDLNSGKIIGAEALLRWWKPDNSKAGGNFISPVDFIPVAEQSGLIVPIGEWVMKKACTEVVEWKEKHGIDIRIAVNVSAAQFTQSDLVSYTKKVIKETGIDPHTLELEVTESVFMDDIDHTIQTLKELHALGVEIAIDDFGTGYSSLSYLRQFPIDRLKIDQSFIRNALNDKDDAAIARTIVGLGHSLSLSVIAEGVETKEHEDFLLEHKCDEVQGYRYSRPVANEDFVKFATGYDGNLSSFDK
ncbi:MAG: putative bifunctional diguanylate cyclase/phosphodiesterase [Alphaproteobacteria bacterium]